MKPKASPEQKLDLAPEIPEIPQKQLESQYECIHCYEGPYSELSDKCKIIIIRDKEN